MYTKNFEPFENKVWLSSPTTHKEELRYITEAYKTNWVSTVGENINEVEKISAKKSEVKYAVALSCCTAALHLCVKLAGERLYGKATIGHGVLADKKVFCSDMTFSATLNPVLYEGGTPIFINTDKSSWNMDPIALKRAFEIYPEVKLVVMAHLYGFPGDIAKIKQICKANGALLIEDTAEALGAKVGIRQCGSFGDYSAISFNGNKIITGSSGGCLLTNNVDEANKARKWSTQARENAPWYQHKDVGYNYRMSNIVAGIVRGQYAHLEEHIQRKKEIYEKYKEGFKNLPVTMNPILDDTTPNYWLSAIIIDKNYMCKQSRTDTEAFYTPKNGKSCPTEILKALASVNAEGRPIWKPMGMQPIYKNNYIVAKDKILVNGIATDDIQYIGKDIFNRGVCLPSDIKMAAKEQDRIIEVIKACFG